MSSELESAGELPRRPDIEPDELAALTPSLWLYVILSLAGSAMLLIALKEGAHFADILVNFGTGLLAAVLILIFVDRRLRRSELSALRDIPRKLRIRLLLLSSVERHIYKYTEAFLASALPQVKDVAPRPEIDGLAHLVDVGFLLVGKPGTGKTTWLQSIAVDRAKLFLKDPENRRSPVLFPMRTWMPDRTLVEALVEYLNKFSRIKKKTFEAAMSKGRVLLILDGIDEAYFIEYPILSNQLTGLREKFSNVPMTMSSRPGLPSPVSHVETMNMNPLTDSEISAFKRLIRF